MNDGWALSGWGWEWGCVCGRGCSRWREQRGRGKRLPGTGGAGAAAESTGQTGWRAGQRGPRAGQGHAQTRVFCSDVRGREPFWGGQDGEGRKGKPGGCYSPQMSALGAEVEPERSGLFYRCLKATQAFSGERLAESQPRAHFNSTEASARCFIDGN